MQAARANALPTRLRLLWELHRGPQGRLRPLAQKLDVTPQAVSTWLKRLESERLVERDAGIWRPTHAGTAELQDSMKELRSFLDDSLERLRLIDETYAFADGRLRPGQAVNLYLKNGHLHAGTGKGRGSRGVTRTAANTGDLVLVGDLAGLLPLSPAPITILLHPDVPTGPPLERARTRLRRLATPQQRRVAVHGVTSLAWARALDLEPDFEFAPVAAALDASFRGLAVLYLAPTSERASCEAQLRESNGMQPPPLRSLEL